MNKAPAPDRESGVGTKPDESIVDGQDLRKRLESILPQSKKKIIFVSAYITQSGIEWLCKHAAPASDKHVVCRLLPSDVISGATQISALRTALEKGCRVSCLHSLHAKIYAVDDQIIYVGSANLTNNGLKIYGQGNLEACIQIPVNKPNLDFINNIITSATLLDENALQKMQACIDLKETEVFFDRWPDGILKEQEGIWVRDFFWSQPGTNQSSSEYLHDLEVMGISSPAPDVATIEKQILKARCVKWLVKTLKAMPDNEIFFGALTQILHDEIKDDPTPYRKDVKSLLQNLLTYCEAYMKEIIEISRPNYSQKIKLLVTGKANF